MAIVKFISDKDCQIFIDKELSGEVDKDSILKLTLEPGGYLIEVKDEVGHLHKKYNLEIKATDNQVLQDVSYGEQSLDDVINQLKNEPSLEFHCDRASFCHNGLYGYVNKRFEVVIPAVKGLNGRYGFIDYHGNLICKLRWASVADFHEGRACVYDDNIERYGFINSYGELQIPCVFDSGDDFHKGVAYVRLNGKKIPIDECGDRIVEEYAEPIEGENSSYERYRGSYAQDEMGYSDDDIDTIFDGDPDAYWNID